MTYLARERRRRYSHYDAGVARATVKRIEPLKVKLDQSTDKPSVIEEILFVLGV